VLEVLQWGIISSRQLGYAHCSCRHGSTVLTRYAATISILRRVIQTVLYRVIRNDCRVKENF